MKDRTKRGHEESVQWMYEKTGHMSQDRGYIYFCERAPTQVDFCTKYCRSRNFYSVRLEHNGSTKLWETPDSIGNLEARTLGSTVWCPAELSSLYGKAEPALKDHAGIRPMASVNPKFC